MSNSKLIIPKTIIVGFQNRSDTYTKKLAYIIYIDDKGVLRKERSWNSWRDHKIDDQEFDNVPTSGFVLNKKVGDYRGSWSGRQAWIRIYDPRDFEFEISVDNLLFILEECSAIKGKGLEGEFVYAWYGKDLVLLPVASQEYKESLRFTEIRAAKSLTKNDLKPGLTYIDQDARVLVYLGYLDYYSEDYATGWAAKKHHIFEPLIPVERGQHYNPLIDNSELSNPNYILLQPKNIKEIHSEDIVSDYPERFDAFKNSINGTRYVPKFEEVTLDSLKYHRLVIIDGYEMSISDYGERYFVYSKTKIEIKDDKICRGVYNENFSHIENISKAELESKQIFRIKFVKGS